MTQGSPARLIFSFAMPMILGNVIQQLYSMVDSAVVGRFVGKSALAAVGATTSVLSLMICIIVGLTMGECILTAQSYGAGDEDRVKTIAGTSIYVACGLMVFLFTIGFIIVRPVLTLLKTPEDVLEQARIYLLINTCTSVAPIFYNLTSNIMRALGDSKSPLYSLISSSLLNIVLDLLFVCVFHWDVAGVAWATAIAQFCSVFVNLYVIKKKHPILHITKKNMKLRPDIVREIIRVGVPMSLQNAVASFGALGVQRFVNTYGTDAMAAYTAAGKLDQISLFPLNSLGMAVSTFVGQNYGKGDYKRIRQGVRAGIVQAILWGAGLMVVILLFGGPLTTLFVSAKETEVIYIAKEYLGTVAKCYWLCGIMYVMMNAFRGMGNMRLSTIAACLDPIGKLLFAAVFSYAFSRPGLWYGWPCGWLLALLPLATVWIIKWRKQN